MTGYVTLLGAEDVTRAGRQIAEAAETISSALRYHEEALQREAQRRDEALAQLAALVARLEKCLGEAVLFLQGEDLTT